MRLTASSFGFQTNRLERQSKGVNRELNSTLIQGQGQTGLSGAIQTRPRRLALHLSARPETVIALFQPLLKIRTSNSLILLSIQ